MNETPSEQIINKNQPVTFTAPSGRTIVIKKVSVPERAMFLRMVGKETDSAAWCGMMMTAFHVVSIDGAVIVKGSILQLSAALQRLDEDYYAVEDEVKKFYDDSLDKEEVIERIKNL